MLADCLILTTTLSLLHPFSPWGAPSSRARLTMVASLSNWQTGNWTRPSRLQSGRGSNLYRQLCPEVSRWTHLDTTTPPWDWPVRTPDRWTSAQAWLVPWSETTEGWTAHNSSCHPRPLEQTLGQLVGVPRTQTLTRELPGGSCRRCLTRRPTTLADLKIYPRWIRTVTSPHTSTECLDFHSRCWTRWASVSREY